MQAGNWPQVTLALRRATTGPQADLLLSSSTSPPATCLSEPAFLCQLGLPCCYFPIAHEDPAARGVQANTLLSHTVEAGFERGVHLLLPSQHQGWLAWGAERAVLLRRHVVQKGCARQMRGPDLLFSVEHYEFLPHRFQTLLQVSILLESTDRWL